MNTNISELIEKAVDSFNAAMLLHTKGYHGFAASRAYYSMFYVASALLLSKQLSFSSHSAVIAAFGKEFAKTGIIDAKYHRYLLSSQRLRDVGDYAIGESVEIVDVEEAMEWATQFIEQAKQFLELGD